MLTPRLQVMVMRIWLCDLWGLLCCSREGAKHGKGDGGHEQWSKVRAKFCAAKVGAFKAWFVMWLLRFFIS